MLLIALPENLTVDVLGTWLLHKDLATLDEAFCNQKSRRAYLEVLRSQGFSLDISPYEREMALLLKWIIDRKIKVNKASIGFQHSPAESDLLAVFLAGVGPHIHDLSISCYSSSTVLPCSLALASCSSLRIRSFWGCWETAQSAARMLITERAGTLERLYFDDSDSHALPEDCKMAKLQYLCLVDCDIDTTRLYSFVANCRHLLYFTVPR
jgi:hypothetical protein